ncbi:Gp19/Gp15/Gp42 family protein [Tsukamurella sp. 1534]|uniref:Gp19/Gp15/Gp42 family protein n=1 Tax=Tsukamurella sp. 1534 TaxID=1151061 RepID=UPI00031B74CC|nr:Gp19/Gp15/Gp42 family protein [Tsukamurella sp. 1534]
MAAFATVDELAAAWRPLTTAERVAAESHLDSVAALIRAQFSTRLGLDDVPEDRLAAAKAVSIEIVKTAIATGMWPGHTQYGRTLGARSKSGTLAVPGGTLALTEWQQQLLGLPVNPAPQWNFPEGDY